MGQKTENSYLVGKLLLAMPNMSDTRFHRAVILICAHDENGAMGLVINNMMPDIKFKNLIKQLNIESDIKVNIEALNMPVMRGGPVESARGFLLHSSDFKRNDTLRINGEYGVTGTIDALKSVATGDKPHDMMFILGYAGWDTGQLDQELQQNAWLVVEPDHDIVFGGNPGEKWIHAITRLGIDPAMLSGTAGNA